MWAVFFGRQQYFLPFPFSSNQATLSGSSETLIQFYPSKKSYTFKRKLLNIETGGRFKSHPCFKLRVYLCEFRYNFVSLVHDPESKYVAGCLYPLQSLDGVVGKSLETRFNKLSFSYNSQAILINGQRTHRKHSAKYSWLIIQLYFAVEVY